MRQLPEEITIEGPNFNAPAIYGNDQHYRLESSTDEIRTYRLEHSTSDDFHSDWPALLCITADSTNDIGLPAQIKVGDRTFYKRMSTSFTPELSSDDVGPCFDILSQLYDTVVTHELNLNVYKLLMESVLDLKQTGDLAMLDFGIGTGRSLITAYKNLEIKRRDLSRLSLSAVDLSQRMVGIATTNLWSQQLTVPCRVSDYAQMPFDSESFDAVIACYVTHYFPDGRPFREIYRVLKPGGILIFNAHRPRFWDLLSMPDRESELFAQIPSIRPPDENDMLYAARFQNISCSKVDVKYEEHGNMTERRVKIYHATK